ncbi:MAG: MFS transporter [Solirubrobacterales bacterium]
MAFLETLFYATLAPLLPSLESELSLSQTGAGLLGAAYPAGMALATIPAGLFADRTNPRLAARAGTAGLALASLAFAFGESVLVLDLARLIQGAAAASAWAGALAALAVASSAHRRGAELSFVVSAAFLGTVLGPVVGVLAHAAGREVVFAVLAGFLVLLAAWGGPSSRHEGVHAPAHPITALRDRPTVRALLLMAVVGVLLGGVQVLGAIFLADRGASAGVIALVFIAAYGSQVVLTPLVGRNVDRRGPGPAIVVALIVSGVTLLFTPLVSATWAACVLLALASSAAAAAYTPVAVQISRIADLLEVGQGLPMALTNGSWGIGAALGAVLLSAVAEAAGSVTAFSLVAALCALALLGVARQPRSGSPAHPGGPDPA